MDEAALVGKLVEPALDALGYELVRVKLSGGDDRRLQIMAERGDRAEMTVDDCAKISRSLSSLLDAEDPIPDAYMLEVSSPGIDRPLVRLEDYDRFSGFDARVESRTPVVDRKKFSGVLKGVVGEDILIDVDGEIYQVPFLEIHRAKLILTDKLIAASQNAHKRQNA